MDRRTFLQELTQGAVLGASLPALSAPGYSSQASTSPGDKEQIEALELLSRVLTPTQVPATGRINATDRTWEEWQLRTGELPPKFSTLPAQPFLPDVLRGVNNLRDWSQRKTEIRTQLEHWLVGRMPPAPDNLRAVTTGERREGDITTRDVRLEFGPEYGGTLRLQLLIPPGHGPRPVFLTNHNRARPWAATAVARLSGCHLLRGGPGVWV